MTRGITISHVRSKHFLNMIVTSVVVDVEMVYFQEHVIRDPLFNVPGFIVYHGAYRELVDGRWWCRKERGGGVE